MWRWKTPLAWAAFVAAVLVGAGIYRWATSAAYMPFRGQDIKLTRPYSDYDDYKNDPNNIDPRENGRVAELVRTAPVAASYDSTSAMIFAVGEVSFPGYGSMAGATKQVDGSSLYLNSIEVPRAGQNRIIVYRERDGRCTLVDDFVVSDDVHILDVADREGKLVYLDYAGKVLVTHALR
jgi:hypothetical protein